jgi:hypothetical protein
VAARPVLAPAGHWLSRDFGPFFRSTVVDLAKLGTLMGCILSLYALFHTAFLVPSADLNQRIYDSIALLALAAGISLLGGLVFRVGRHERHGGRTKLAATLPVQLFCWGVGIMLVLFVVSWYLNSHCIFYRDTRL